MTNRFVQGGGERLLIWSLLGAVVGFLLGLTLTGIPGGLLVAFLGVLVVRRLSLIRPRLPRERLVDYDAHPTKSAQQRLHQEGVTWAPIQKPPGDPGP